MVATMMSGAVLKGNTKLVKLMLFFGVDPNGLDCQGFRPIYYAVDRQDIPLTKLLLGSGALAEDDPYGRTESLVVRAVKRGDSELVELVAGAGGNVNAQDDHGKTPLMWASILGRVDIASILIQKGAEINRVTPSGDTALTCAVKFGHTECVQLLLRHGSNPCLL